VIVFNNRRVFVTGPKGVKNIDTYVDALEPGTPAIGIPAEMEVCDENGIINDDYIPDIMESLEDFGIEVKIGDITNEKDDKLIAYMATAIKRIEQIRRERKQYHGWKGHDAA